jgi:HTH-type transcriptional regulator / antitoxin HipB
MYSVDSIHAIAAAVRGRRLSLGLSQAQLADRARVSRQWISEFEAGKPTAELGLVLRLIDALGLCLNLAEPAEGACDDRPHPRPHSDETFDLDGLLEEYSRR